jgi:inner membrane protein
MAVRIVAPAAPVRLTIAACVCAAFPDLDSFLGLEHRGFLHSLLFAALLAAVTVACIGGERPYRTWALLFVVGASHGLLDAMTDAGAGIAFFAPFSDARYFLPWRPLVCPPLGIAPFFSEWGLRVLRSEVMWVWAPLLGLLVLVRLVQGSSSRLR